MIRFFGALVAPTGAAVLIACTSSPPPKLPGDPWGACPDGLRFETPTETYQRAGQRRGTPIKTRPECVLAEGRCITASDCPNKVMECRHFGSGSGEVGFCVEPPVK